MNHLARRIGPLLLLALVGCAGGEPVTPAALKAAKAKWAAAGVRNYDLEWKSSGAREGRYRVFVRDGEVKTIYSIVQGKEVVAKPGQPKFYGVDGLFLVVEEDLAQLDQPAPFGRPKGSSVAMRMTIDPKYGYPLKYLRDVSGTRTGVTIEVLRFDAAPPSEIPPPAALR